MKPVALSRPLVLETSHRVPDGAGGYTEAWLALGTLWAEVVAGTGREDTGSAFVTLSRVPYRITVRGAPQGAPSRPKPAQRFRDGARLFRIVAVTEREASGLHLICFAHEEVPA